jgi:hypothetical protein
MPNGVDNNGRTVQDLVLGQLKELSTASGNHGKTLATIAASQQTQANRLQTVEKTMKEMWEAELSCPARGGFNALSRRVSKIEARDMLKKNGNADQTGSIDTTATNIPIQVQPTADGQGFRVTGPLVMKYLPWIVLASMGLIKAFEAGFFGIWAQ